MVALSLHSSQHGLMQGLRNKAILLTRSTAQSAESAALVRSHGATPLSLPCLEIELFPSVIRKAVAEIRPDSYLLFTSSNGVSAVADALGDELYTLAQTHRVIAIGSKTAAALQAYRIKPLPLPKTASQEGLVELCRKLTPPSILFFRAEVGRNLLIDALKPLGTPVDLVVAYRTQCPSGDAREVIAMIRKKQVDAVLLGSSRTCDHYLQRMGDIEIANTPAVAVISKQVAFHAESIGLSVQAVAEEATFSSMLTVLARHFVLDT